MLLKNFPHHYHFDTLDMKIDSVNAICRNNFRVQEYSKIDDKTYSLKMKKMNSDNQSFV